MRLTPHEKQVLELAADRAGVSMADAFRIGFRRQLLTAAEERELSEAEQRRRGR